MITLRVGLLFNVGRGKDDETWVLLGTKSANLER